MIYYISIRAGVQMRNNLTMANIQLSNTESGPEYVDLIMRELFRGSG
jgi:hypothetical protein